MAPVTLQMLSDVESTIKTLKGVISADELKYHADYKCNLDAYEKRGQSAPAEKVAESKALLASIQKSEQLLSRLQFDLIAKTIRYYVESHLDQLKVPKVEPTEEKSSVLVAGKKRPAPDDFDSLVTMAKRNDRGYVIITQDGDLYHENAECDRATKKVGLNWPTVKIEARVCLDEVVDLLSTSVGRAITHQPKQMNRLADAVTTNHHDVLNVLTTCIRDLQSDSRVLGHAAMAMLRGKMGPYTVPDLVASLESTYDPHDLREIYRTEAEGGTAKILESLDDEDQAKQKAMVLRLLYSAIVLCKYTCLATSLAVALSPKFARGQPDAQWPSITDRALKGCLELHRELLGTYITNTAGAAQRLHEPRANVDYNPRDEVRGKLADPFILGRFKTLERYMPRTDYTLAKFLGSVGHGKD